MNKRIRSQRSQNHEPIGQPPMTLRGKLSTSWKKLIDWSKEEPYLSFFLEIIFLSPIISVISLAFILLITRFVYLFFQALINNTQMSAPVFAAVIAFLGVCLTVAMQAWMTIYKSRIERQVDTSRKMYDYYERISKILNNPGNYSLKEVFAFLNKFDDKVKTYGSKDIKYKWLKFQLRERIMKTQENPRINTDSEDLEHFTRFIQAIGKEMGYESNKVLNKLTYKDLKSKYLKQEKLLSIQNCEAANISTNSTSENNQKDFQAAWANWFEEVEQLEPESPQLEADEYGKALIDKYKKQGLDL